MTPFHGDICGFALYDRLKSDLDENKAYYLVLHVGGLPVIRAA